jgi:predicted transcriptional regulator
MKKFNTTSSFENRARLLLITALMLIFAGCSSVRLTYNHGDTLLYWWLNNYLDLNSEQSGWVKKDIDNLFQWHRKTQLNDYAQLLANGQRQLASGNLSEADLMADYREIKSRSELLAYKALPELADLARSIRPEQIVHMEKKFAKNNEDFRRKFMRGDQEDRQKARFKKSMEQFELWFGRFSSEQEAVLRKASDARLLDNEIWLDERIRRQKRIVAVVRKVQQEKLSKEATIALLHTLVKEIFDRFEAPERKAFFDTYTEQTVQLILTAVRIATPAQKAHAHKRMQGWIDDFHVLANDTRH